MNKTIELLKEIRKEAGGVDPNWATIQSLASDVWSIIEKLESAINFALDECRQTQAVCGRGWWDLVINRLEQALKGK